MKIAFYLMNTKGYSTLVSFVKEFGSSSIAYIVSEEDKNVKDDPFLQIKKLAQSHHICFYSRKNLPINVENEFNNYKFAIGWRWIISSTENLVIFHDSLLPKYRGFAPLVNSLINKDEMGGVTALLANVNYDAGEIIGQKSVSFNYPLKINDAIKLIEPLYFYLVKDIYLQIKQKKELIAQKQQEEQATFSLWLDNKDYFIDWTWSAEKIKRFIDAVGYPYDGAKALINNEIVKIIDAELVDDVFVEHRHRHIGKIIFMQDAPIIVCNEGLLKLTKIKNSNNEDFHTNFRTRFN